MKRLISWFLALFAPKPKQIPPWEPKGATDFRKRIGFIDRRPADEPRTKLGDEIVKAQREALFERIMATTDPVHPDRRIKRQLHGNAMEFRARWDGRAWEPQPPMFDRAESWGFGVKPVEDFEANRIAAGMRDG
jgi:hypothetical protein